MSNQVCLQNMSCSLSNVCTKMNSKCVAIKIIFFQAEPHCGKHKSPRHWRASYCLMNDRFDLEAGPLLLSPFARSHSLRHTFIPFVPKLSTRTLPKPRTGPKRLEIHQSSLRSVGCFITPQGDNVSYNLQKKHWIAGLPPNYCCFANEKTSKFIEII